MIRALSKREQTLAIIVGAIVAVGGTIVLAQSYLGTRAALTGKIASEQRQLRSLRMLMSESSLWEQRDRWLDEKQPKLENADTAGVQLLDYVSGLAQKNTVSLENQAIHAPEKRPTCTSVALDIETKSAWPGLISFLEELQSPEQFIALETANVKVDPTDPTQIRGHFKIARWYAPN